jgi:hypothetical protein
LETSPILTRIIDQACSPLAERIEDQRMPAIMRVHPTVFGRIRDIRAREVADGYPLMFLGIDAGQSGLIGRDARLGAAARRGRPARVRPPRAGDVLSK